MRTIEGILSENEQLKISNFLQTGIKEKIFEELRLKKSIELDQVLVSSRYRFDLSDIFKKEWNNLSD